VLGIGMKTGVDLAFDEHNRGLPPTRTPLRLIALDDGYEPDRCAPNMRTLTEKEQVLAVIGNVGTPTAIAALPIVNQTGTPFFGAYTGAGVLRKDPPDPAVINFRASYAQETSAMVDALVNEAGLKPEEVAFFTQRDGYGDSGFNGGIAALTRHGLKSASDVVHGRYERNTLAVESALAEILLAKTAPRAVIMVGAYAPCAEFVEQARALGFEPLFLNVSFVGANPLAEKLGDKGDGVIITQVVPHFDSDLPIVVEYRRALKALDPALAPSFCSLEGYIAGRIFCRALDSIDGAPTRKSLADALLGMGKFDIGLGIELELGQGKHQACDRVWPTVIRAGKVVPFEWTGLKSLLRQ
jgi:ABC-type branched-subunit amino acid transport system substrate-binding protein